MTKPCATCPNLGKPHPQGACEKFRKWFASDEDDPRKVLGPLPLEVLDDLAEAQKAIDAVIHAVMLDPADPEKFRREVELAQAHLRGIALRMGWSK